MIDLQRWCLHLEWGPFLPTLRDVYGTFSFRREIPLFFSNWVKGGMWKNVTKRFSFFDSIVQFDSMLSRSCLSQYHCLAATTVAQYHLELSSCPRRHSRRHLRCESRRAMGRGDMTSKPGCQLTWWNLSADSSVFELVNTTQPHLITSAASILPQCIMRSKI